MSSEDGTVPKGGEEDDSGIAQPVGRPKRRLRLRILLDTNQLFTGSASDLLQAALRKLIEESRSHNDISIEWLLPDVVRFEREYQMTSAAIDLIPNLKKLERVLGHNLAITDEVLSARVREAIERQIRELNLVSVPLDVTSVDWNAIVQAALFRRPPFEKSKEKGFRDALIAECFMQAINQSPKNASLCRIAIVTDDGLLAETMEQRISSRGNVRILRTLDDLQSLINTLVSNVTEQFVDSVRDIAQAYFFTKGSKDGLYYKAGIRDLIVQSYNEKLKELPTGATSRENGTWWIGSPSFVEKKGQRIFWRTSIEIEANSFKSEWPKTSALSFATRLMPEPSSGLSSLGGKIPTASTHISSVTSAALPHGFGSMETLDPQNFRGLTLDAALSGLPEKLLVSKGRSLFHVTWSVVISSKRNFSHPKIENIEWKETVWE